MSICINEIVMNSFAGAVRTMLLDIAEKVNEKVFELAKIKNTDDRLQEIIKLFELSDEDNKKIVQVKKTEKKSAGGNGGKKIAEKKKMPVPFWIYTKDGQSCNTIKQDMCQGLTAGLYAQCAKKPKTGGIYCTNCQKDADANGGVPKRGNVTRRVEQFECGCYDYTTPDGKVRKIYPLHWAMKNKYTLEEFRNMLAENNIVLTDHQLKIIEKIPEKKGKGKKAKTNLTADMDDNLNEDDADDNSSVYSVGTHTANDDDDDELFNDVHDVPEPEPEPEPETKPEPEPEAEPILKSAMKNKLQSKLEPTNFVITSIDKVKYAIPKNYNDLDEFDVYEINYKSKNDWKFVGNTPIGKFNKDEGELVIYEKK